MVDMPANPFEGDQMEALLMFAARAVRQAFDAGLAEIDLNMSTGAVIGNLAAYGPLTQAALADRLRIGRAAAGSLIDSLETRGLVTREADPADRRVWMVTLTSEGHQVAKEFEARHAAIRAALHKDIPSAERKRLSHLLCLLAATAAASAGGGAG